MKKLFLILTLCLGVMFSSALAEEAAYVPGQISHALIGEAWDAGKIITADLQFLYAENAGTAVGEDVRDMIDEILHASTLTIGVGRFDGGIRIVLGGEYRPEGSEQSVSIDAAINLTPDGVSVESSLIEGERITAQWETLLALCGADQNTIAQIMVLRELDMDSLLSKLPAQLEQMLNQFAQLLTPYAETCADFLAGLPVEMNENVPAEGDFPAAAIELVISCTDQDVAALLMQLADQLEQDATLCAFIDLIAANGNSTIAQVDAGEIGDLSVSLWLPTSAQICAGLRECAGILDSSADTYTLYLGFDEEQNPLYESIVGGPTEDGITVVFNIILSPTFSFETFIMDEQGNALEGISVVYSCDIGEETFDGEIGFACYEGDVTFGAFQFLESVRPTTTGDGQPAYTHSLSMTLAGQDTETAETLYMIFSSELEYAQTSEGGERTVANGAQDFYLDGQNITVSYQAEHTLTPTADGFTGFLRETVSQPGTDDITVEMTYYPVPYDPASTEALAQTALETVSIEEMNALKERVTASLQSTLTDLLALLPADASQMIAGAMAE